MRRCTRHTRCPNRHANSTPFPSYESGFLLTLRRQPRSARGQYIQFDLYMYYNTEDQNDPPIAELASTIKELKAMDIWKKKCGNHNTMCLNYRANIKTYETQLRRIKKNGRQRNKYAAYSPRQLRALFTSPEFTHLLNDMVSTSNKLRVKFTQNSIRSIEKVTPAFIKKYYRDVTITGSMWRLRCKCVVAGTAGVHATAENISHSLNSMDWTLHNNIAKWLNDHYQRPYRGQFEPVALQIHAGGAPAVVGTHIVTISKSYASVEELLQAHQQDS